MILHSSSFTQLSNLRIKHIRDVNKLCSTLYSYVGISLAFNYWKSILTINFNRISNFWLLEGIKVLTNPNMEWSLPDWNKIQNNKNSKLFIILKNTAITFNCFVRVSAVVFPAGKTTECENISCLPYTRTLRHGPKCPNPLVFSWRDSWLQQTL